MPPCPSQGLVLRDFKPGNVLVSGGPGGPALGGCTGGPAAPSSSGGRRPESRAPLPVLIDFDGAAPAPGLSPKEAHARGRGAGRHGEQAAAAGPAPAEFTFTPPYVAPEVALAALSAPRPPGAPPAVTPAAMACHGPKGDVFAFGVAAWQLAHAGLTGGRLPYPYSGGDPTFSDDAAWLAALAWEEPPLDERLSAPLVKLIRACLAKDPSKRASARTLLCQLDKWRAFVALTPVLEGDDDPVGRSDDLNSHAAVGSGPGGGGGGGGEAAADAADRDVQLLTGLEGHREGVGPDGCWTRRMWVSRQGLARQRFWVGPPSPHERPETAAFVLDGLRLGRLCGNTPVGFSPFSPRAPLEAMLPTLKAAAAAAAAAKAPGERLRSAIGRARAVLGVGAARSGSSSSSSSSVASGPSITDSGGNGSGASSKSSNGSNGRKILHATWAKTRKRALPCWIPSCCVCLGDGGSVGTAEDRATVTGLAAPACVGWDCPSDRQQHDTPAPEVLARVRLVGGRVGRGGGGARGSAAARGKSWSSGNSQAGVDCPETPPAMAASLRPSLDSLP
jgi:hypothetical protein